MPLRSLVPRLLGLITVLYVGYAYLVRFERRVIGRLSLGGDHRWGPLWPLVDVTRALFKPNIVSDRAHRILYLASPMLTLSATVMAFALVPLGPSGSSHGGELSFGITDLDGSLLIALCLGWFALLGILLAGWASGRAYLWREGCRAVSLAWVYSLPALFALGGAIMLSGSLSLERIAQAQASHSGAQASHSGAQGLPYIVYQPLGLLVFALSLLAGGRRLPYRPPDGAGARHAAPLLLSDFHLQHAGGVLALYHFAEYLHLFLISALTSTVYLAGWRGPWLDGPHWLAVKTLVVAGLLLWVRDSWLARQRQRLGNRLWGILMCLATLNTLLTGAILAWSP